MLTHLFLVLATHLALVGGLQERASWSGTWTSDARDVSIARNQHTTPRGWDQQAENLAASRNYGISIEETGDSMAIVFLGSTSNILNTPAIGIGTGPQVRVTNHGDWWMKEVAAARRAGAEIEMTSVSSSGWWRDGGPHGAAAQPTDLKKLLRLVPGGDADHISLRVALADEKGELEYVQIFHRQRQH
jgi:hypothetical protein